LLVNWLNQLRYLFQAEGVLFTDFSISTMTDERLKAVCTGNQVDLQRHPMKIQVKAARAHSVTVFRGNGIGIDVEVVLDRSY
jgi:SHS2 domain-containing protein